MGGDMTWGKRLIIALGLLLLTNVAHARGIESFTDSQGTLHITNLGPKKPDSPATPPNPEASLSPSRLRSGNVQVIPPAQEPAPATPVPEPMPEPVPEPEAAPQEPGPVNPQPGARVTHTEGSGGVMPVSARTGEKERPGAAAEAPAASLQRASWSPPQPVRAVPDGKIAIHRDRHGVIHITNVPREDEGPVAPVNMAQAVQKRGPPLAGAPPAVQLASYPVPAPAAVQRLASPPDAAFPAIARMSCPELGPEVADYLDAKLRDLPRP